MLLCKSSLIIFTKGENENIGILTIGGNVHSRAVASLSLTRKESGNLACCKVNVVTKGGSHFVIKCAALCTCILIATHYNAGRLGGGLINHVMTGGRKLLFLLRTAITLVGLSAGLSTGRRLCLGENECVLVYGFFVGSLIGSLIGCFIGHLGLCAEDAVLNVFNLGSQILGQQAAANE